MTIFLLLHRLLPIFWFVAIAFSTLKLAYLVQLKEYRMDRLFSFFKTHDGRRFFFSFDFWIYPFTVVLIVVLTFLAPPAFPFIIIFFIPVHYFLFFLFVISQLFHRKLFRPTFTAKSFLLVFLSLISLLFRLPWSVLFSDSSLVGQSVIFFFLNLFLPFVFLFWLVLLQIATTIVKKIIYAQARKTMARFPHIKVIGITGSFGKSSTKEFLATILGAKYRVLKTEKNINSEIGVAQTVLRKLKAEHEIFIVEMGAYRKGEISQMCHIVRPSIGIITGLNEQHIDLFGSFEAIQNAKFELIQSLPSDGLAIFNGDIEACRKLSERTQVNKILYSKERHADYFATDISQIDDYLSFIVHDPSGKTLKCSVNLIGVHTISNLLAAIAVASFFGMSFKEISEALHLIRPPHKTLEPFSGISGTLVIDDSYSANPDGVLAALDALSHFKGGRKIMIMRDMIELGSYSEEAHRKVAKRAAEVCDLVIGVRSGKRCKSLLEEDVASGRHVCHEGLGKVMNINDPKKILQTVQQFVRKGDIILLENRIPASLIQALKAP